jgi:hypothetical protein
MQATVGFAFETDEYNLPLRPLADIGNEVNEYVESNVLKSVEKVNSEILQRETFFVNWVKDRDFAEKNQKRLAYLRSNVAVAGEVYREAQNIDIDYLSQPRHKIKVRSVRSNLSVFAMT